MTIAEIDSIDASTYNEAQMKPLFDEFSKRYKLRYFDQIKVLRDHESLKIKYNCGFIMTSIDCILIETLEQFYSGTNETKIANEEVYLRYFARTPEMRKVINSKKGAGKFYRYVRCGLLHQSKTKQDTKINVKHDTPILEWVDEADMDKGLNINRNLFHDNVREQYKKYLEKVKTNVDLREKFLKKMKSIVGETATMS